MDLKRPMRNRLSRLTRSATSGKRRSKRFALHLETLEDRQLLAGDTQVLLGDVIMFNDHRTGSRTGEFVTSYADNGASSGTLLNYETGDDTGIVLTTTGVGANYGLWSFWPAEGTDAYEIFAGQVDFTVGAGAEIELSGDDSYTHTFSNLDTNSEYDFTGTHARGNGSYDNRWTLVTLVGADSFTAAHSVGRGVVTDGLNANQVAIWTGENQLDDQGFVARWTEIDPGDDGEFEVIQQQYRGAIPTNVFAAGLANGSSGYGLTAVRLIKSFAGLAVLDSDPGLNAKFASAPTTATMSFSSPVDASTVNAADLTVDGTPATAVTVVDADTVRWTLPTGLGIGEHTIALAEGSMKSATDGQFIGYCSTFLIVTTARIDSQAVDQIDATTAELEAQIGSTGFDDPDLLIYWGDNDGGTIGANWDNVLDLGLRGVGSHRGAIAGLSPSKQYFFRAQTSNLAGEAWFASTASFTTATPTLPAVVNGAATDVSAFTATLGGEVLADGEDPPAITLFYGTSDGGTSAATWQNSIDLGKHTSTFETFVVGLTKETDYFYRIRATNLAGSQWAAASSTFTTTGLPALTISEVAPSNTGDLRTRIRVSVDDDFGAEISPDWIEIHNPSPADLDLVGLHLTDSPNDRTKWAFPLGTIVPANGYIVVYATNENLRDPNLDNTGRLHTNFTLTGSGEYLALTGGAGEVIFEYAPMIPDTKSGYTYGLDDSGSGAYFEHPTPGAANDNASIFLGFVADTRFSIDRGFYDAPITVGITSNTLGATIAYTTDGSEPTLTNGVQVAAANASTTPSAAVNVTTTTAIRARAYLDNWIPTNVDTHSYVFLTDVIRQPDIPAGFPTRWGSAPAVDYGMDPEIVDNPAYTSDLMAGLREIPTLSLNSAIADFFGPGGIYSNTNSETLEIGTSAELILPDGSSGFQINAGLKIQGGASRNPESSPKHSMSLRFRDEYGEGKLNYPLFDDSPVNSFDGLQLRAMYNNSWIHWSPDQRPRGTLIRDQWMRDSLLAMGQGDAQRGTYVHLYLDGIYWGVYNLHERGEANHYAAYNGGDANVLDALNGGTATDGNLTSYNAMKATVATQNWDEIQKVLDVDNYIDWTIMQRFGSNNDLKADGNWRAAGGGPTNEPWRFYSWDGERILEGVNEGGPGGTADPPAILATLNQIDEFRVRFADRIQMHFFNGGALTPESVADRWNARVDELSKAIVAESARWGDYRRDVHVRDVATLFTRDDHWLPEINRLRNTYFPQRTNIVVGQYRSLGLYPSVAAPIPQIDGTAQHGGVIEPGANLGFVSGAGTVYYTLDGTDPRAVGGDAAGIPFGQPVPLSESTTVNARVFEAGAWSALVTTRFTVVPAVDAIVVSEINYNPHDANAAESALVPNLSSSDFEFIEVLNTSSTAVNLLGMQFTNGIDFTFPNVLLAAGDRAVIVENTAGFRARYGEAINVVGQWSGGLSNSGERLVLVDGVGNTVLDLEYADSTPWAVRADGFGGTLVLADESNITADLSGKYYSWRGGSEFGGTPGAASDAELNIVVNEVLANSDDKGNGDAIEIYNRGSVAADISGWYLSDSGNDLLKFAVPAGTSVPAGGYVVFDESDFNPTPLAPGARDFALNGTTGDDVWLVIPDGAGGVASFVDDVHFGAAKAGESLGRVDDHAAAPLARQSFGCANSHPRVGPLVISEVQYNPGEPADNALTIYPELVEDDLEFIEIHNPTSAAVDLQNWQITAGISYQFGTSVVLAAGQTVVVVSFNPDSVENAIRTLAFRAHYQIENNVVLVGGYGGQLSDSGEVIRLRDPDGVVEDEVAYDDRSPWGASADGKGASLRRVQPTAWGNSATTWDDALGASPGAVSFSPQRGDFNIDGQMNVTDINMLLFAIDSRSGVNTYDIDANGVIDGADTRALLSLIGTLPGDANLDGTVNATDLNRVGINWLSSNCASWERGDFSGDGFVDATDLNILGLNWLKDASQQAIVNPRVPRAALSQSSFAFEPSALSISRIATPNQAQARTSHDLGTNDIIDSMSDQLRVRVQNRIATRDGIRRRSIDIGRVPSERSNANSHTDDLADTTDAIFANLLDQVL